ncbi:hypothetical protein [Altibacter sp.]|uniref:hypothetical protein n=1 Tax=Altibacter sp. TaxID=2024823 RepID=UPI0025BACC34|nr:hypothetical protein [Altibacter sp.]|tara:strand:- start:228 stop:842 length:615 start_codon:yes stop_codon:yes gene_type:complete
MAKEQEMITDEKWTAWTNAIIEWGENFDSHLQTLVDAPEGQFEIDDEEMEANWATIQNKINRGNKRPARRNDLKKQIQEEGRKMPNWPHSRGAGSSLTPEQQAARDKFAAIARLAAIAEYQVFVENDATHLLVQRASKANQTEGEEFPSQEAFVEYREKAAKATATGYLSGKTAFWGAKDEEDNVLPFDFQQKIVRPIPVDKEE